MTPYSTVLALSRRGVVRLVFLISVALRLRGTLGTFVYIVVLVHVRSFVNIVALTVVILVDIRALWGILLALGLLTICPIMLDDGNRAGGARWPDHLAEKMGRAAVHGA
ncbi:MAG TPA: hypothetical protein VM716_03120 [Gemmatimonadales bacterium]|nr:hypothetical protein [Gemmatimonadales bacterium]